MPSVSFANIIFEPNSCSSLYPGLYCRSLRPPTFDDTAGEWMLPAAGAYDFATYFNSLSVLKLREYTTMTAATLHVELKGAAVRIEQTMGDAFASEPMPVEGSGMNVAESKEWTSVDFPLVIADDMVVTGFTITTEGKVWIRDAHYTLDVAQEPAEVELVLATTTFKKEEYITRNVRMIQRRILDGNDDIAKHFRMLVIDNGRTLDPAALDSDGVTVVPNENVGGAGGFTRGMIMAMEGEAKATHVLLMDDDVAVSPESIMRTYNLLRIVKPEYGDAMVSGAMMNYEIGDQQWEDTGFVTAQGTFAPCKWQLLMSRFRNLVYNEVFRPRESMTRRNHYAGWWYCCIPVDVIERNGLPLPVFVRGDDAEYGIRCGVPYMTMNSLCVWHMPFDEKYDPAVERYQVPRNALAIQAMSDVAPNADFMRELHHNVELELKKFGYENAELCLDGFEDFLKGPQFFMDKERVRDSFMAAHRNKEQLVDFKLLQEEISADPDFEGLRLSDIDPLRIQEMGERSLVQRANDLLTDNGQRFLPTEGEGYAVIPIMGWMYPAERIRGKKKLLVVDWYSRKGTVRVKDADRYARILKRWKRDLRYYKTHREELGQQYQEAFPKLTSLAFWKAYLDMD